MNISIIVLVYNHENYICDCLNSIKYQVQNYAGKDEHKVQVVVANDASTDNSVATIKRWIYENKQIVPDIVLLNNKHNLGTCGNYLNALDRCTGDYIKIMGGDDIFPENSIFQIFEYLDCYDVVQGLPFIYYENKKNNIDKLVRQLNKRYRVNLQEEKNDFYTMIHRYCFLNAPATYVSKELLLDTRVREYISEYRYTDDYSMWLKISEIKKIRYAFVPVISVIYRRTEGSAYIIHNEVLREERLRLCKYALDTCQEFIGKIILKQSISANKNNGINSYFCLRAYLNELYYLLGDKNVEFDAGFVNHIIKYIDKIKRM